jgi:hypothetical protein
MYVVTTTQRRSTHWYLHGENSLAVDDSRMQPTGLDAARADLLNGGGSMRERGLQTPEAAQT